MKSKDFEPCKLCQKPVFNATGICLPCRTELKNKDRERKKRMGVKYFQEHKMREKEQAEAWKYLK